MTLASPIPSASAGSSGPPPNALPAALRVPVQATPLPAGVDIKPRRMKFDYTASPKFWFDGEPVLTRFAESLSMLFPEGERFFVESVQHFRDQIVDPELKNQVSAFTAQEGTHAAEHQKYNAHVAGERSRGYESLAGHIRQNPLLSPMDKLAATVALEHFTAMLADEFLKDPTYAHAMDPAHARLWRWHAVEETEHKAVAFDVYKAVGGEYWRRALMMNRMTLGLILSTGWLMTDMLVRDRKEVEARHALRFVTWGFVTPGFFRRIVPAWFDYFRPGFHPWQNDNSALVAAWKATYAASGAPAAT